MTTKLYRLTVFAGAIYSGPFQEEVIVFGYAENWLPVKEPSVTVVLERMVESQIVPGLFFDLVQHSLTYGNLIRFPSTAALQLLMLLETNGGVADQEEALTFCWAKKNAKPFLPCDMR